MFETKLQAIKERSGLNIKSGHVFIDVKDRDWLFATIDNLMFKIKEMEKSMDKGLYKKFTVIDNETGKEITEQTFVLIPSVDKTAVRALKTYAQYTTNEKLSADLFKWVNDSSKGGIE